MKHSPHRWVGSFSDLEKHLPPGSRHRLLESLSLNREDEATTGLEVDACIAYGGLKKGDYLLDLCCGAGRHSIELAKRGFEPLYGVDRSRFLIHLAKKRARQEHLRIQFSEGDARRIRLPEQFIDTICVLGNAFGYFERIEDDLLVLESVKKTLKSGGQLLIDLIDGEWMQRHFEPRSWQWVDAKQFICRERSLSQDKLRLLSREVVVHTEAGVVADQFYAERLFTIEELRKLMKQAGLLHVEIEPHMMGDLPHLMLLARAPRKKGKNIREAQKRVAVLLNHGSEPEKELKEHLALLAGYEFSYLSDHENLPTKKGADLVFHLADGGYKGDRVNAAFLPTLLELAAVPYSGPRPTTLSLCANKAWVRALAQSLEIPVPRETFIDPSDLGALLPSFFPAVLKSNFGELASGLTRESVVHNAEGLIGELDRLHAKHPGHPFLLQEFLNGPEYSVGLIGNVDRLEVLPILEVDYSRLPANLPPILAAESPYHTRIRYKRADLDEQTRRLLIDHATHLFERLECRDFARVDFRADTSGTLKLLEVNPHPATTTESRMHFMASLRELDYSQFLEQILRSAFERSTIH
jgi:D-alanine-D-alanine ligase